MDLLKLKSSFYTLFDTVLFYLVYYGLPANIHKDLKFINIKDKYQNYGFSNNCCCL